MTPKQFKLLTFLRNQFSHGSKGPSFSLMKNYMNVSSNQTIEDWLSILERDGYIKRVGGSRRSIVLTDKATQIIVQYEKTQDLGKVPLPTFVYHGSVAVTSTNSTNLQNTPVIPFNEFNREGT